LGDCAVLPLSPSRSNPSRSRSARLLSRPDDHPRGQQAAMPSYEKQTDRFDTHATHIFQPGRAVTDLDDFLSQVRRHACPPSPRHLRPGSSRAATDRAHSHAWPELTLRPRIRSPLQKKPSTTKDYNGAHVRPCRLISSASDGLADVPSQPPLSRSLRCRHTAVDRRLPARHERPRARARGPRPAQGRRQEDPCVPFLPTLRLVARVF
jgi:hypothetical protein